MASYDLNALPRRSVLLRCQKKVRPTNDGDLGVAEALNKYLCLVIVLGKLLNYGECFFSQGHVEKSFLCIKFMDNKLISTTTQPIFLPNITF